MDDASRDGRKQTIFEMAERYGAQYVQKHARRIAQTIVVHYGYASGEDSGMDLKVRIYNRARNVMEVISFTEVLALVPVQPAELRTTEFGQVILSDTVYLSTTIYACIVSVLTSIGMLKGT